jgi:hypothetical protein
MVNELAPLGSWGSVRVARQTVQNGMEVTVVKGGLLEVDG